VQASAGRAFVGSVPDEMGYRLPMSFPVRSNALVPVVAAALLIGAACGESAPASTQDESDDGGRGDVVAPVGSGGARGYGAGGSGMGGTPSTGGVAADADAPIDASAGNADTEPDPEDAPAAPAGDGGVPGLGGPPRPCKFQLCESFEGEEGAAPDPQVWTRNNEGLVLSSKYAARGTKSLHVPPMNSGQYFIRETKTFPAMNGAFYGRFYLWIERIPVEAPATLYHWTFLEGSDSDTDKGGWVIRLGGHHRANRLSLIRFNINTHTGEGEDGTADLMHGFLPKQWYCIEFYFDTPRSEARFWINGVENTMLHWLKNRAGAYIFPTLKTLRFGWAEYQGTKTPYESYIDEIAIDPNRIGCEQ
jgi:hypothetical protein